MPEIPKGAILQRDKETYAIVPRTPVGMLRPEDLEAIAKVVRKYHIPVIKITSGQRFALVGMKKDDVDSIWKDLGMEVGKATELCLHYVQACPGNAVCKYGVQDSLGLGMEIEDFFSEMDLAFSSKRPTTICSVQPPLNSAAPCTEIPFGILYQPLLEPARFSSRAPQWVNPTLLLHQKGTQASSGTVFVPP
jgi:hypothetical protein